MHAVSLEKNGVMVNAGSTLVLIVLRVKMSAAYTVYPWGGEKVSQIWSEDWRVKDMSLPVKECIVYTVAILMDGGIL